MYACKLELHRVNFSILFLCDLTSCSSIATAVEADVMLIVCFLERRVVSVPGLSRAISRRCCGNAGIRLGFPPYCTWTSFQIYTFATMAVTFNMYKPLDTISSRAFSSKHPKMINLHIWMKSAARSIVTGREGGGGSCAKSTSQMTNVVYETLTYIENLRRIGFPVHVTHFGNWGNSTTRL